MEGHADYRVSVRRIGCFLFGWYWEVAPPREEGEIGLGIDGVSNTRRGAHRAARRCIRREQREEASRERFSVPPRTGERSRG